jgi:hypothetical protein
VSDVFSTIERLYLEFRHPFPYADCRKMQVLADDQAADLIPDHDAYFADLAGYCSRGSRIARMSPEEFLKMKRASEKSFFEKHPEYQAIKSFISKSGTPDLFRDLELTEKMRAALLEIFELHVADQSVQ